MRQAIVVSLLVLVCGSGPARAQDRAIPDSLQTRIWLDRGDEPVVNEGEDVRVYYRANVDSYGAIFRVDTDGRVHLVFPQHPGVDPSIRGGRDYRLLFGDAPRWRVRDDPGVGYFFVLASAEPLDFSLFDYDDRDGWDLSSVGDVVYEDPYVAIDDYVGALLPDWDVVPHALDFLEYNVDEEHDYPRFLCYDCHDSRSWSDWDPYQYQCPTYQVVIWDDPYYRPSFRYSGTMVVVMRPFGPRPRYEVARRVRGTPWGPVVRQRPAPPRLVPVYKEPATRPGIQRRPPVRPSVARGAGARRGAAVAPRAPAARPSGRVRRSPDARPATGARSQTTGVRPSTPRVNPSTGSVRPSTARPSPRTGEPSSGRSRPVVGAPSRPSAPAPTARPTVRPSTQRPTAGARGRDTRAPAARAPATRPRGSSGSARPSARPGSSTGNVRPGARSGPTGGAARGARPPVRRGGTPAGARSAPAPARAAAPARPRASTAPSRGGSPAPTRVAPRRPAGGPSAQPRRTRNGRGGEAMV